MKTTLLIFISFLFIQAQTETVKYKKIRWKKFHTASQLKDFIFSDLPAKPSMDEVTAYLKCQKGYTNKHEKIIYFTSKSWSVSFMISKCWLLEFHFDEQGNFLKFMAEAGLTGP